jgi:hypothetical protein
MERDARVRRERKENENIERTYALEIGTIESNKKRD